jgi:multicomponent Na+:H+ antiporter subunit F
MEGVAPSGPGWATFWEVLVGLAMLSIIVAVVRLARGPTLADRVVALDLIATIAVVTAALSSIAYSQPVFLDLAVVLTLVPFVATVAFARAIQRTAQP